MSEYLKFYKDGSIKLLQNDTSLRGKYRCNNCQYRGKKNLWEIIDFETKEIFKTFDNADDAEEFFYTEKPINNIFQVLRNGIVVEKGFLIEHLLSFLGKDELLTTLFYSSGNCKHARLYFEPLGTNEGITDVKIQPTIRIDGESFDFSYEMIPSDSFELAVDCDVYINGEKSYGYEFNYSFIDVIVAILGGNDTPVKITKTGFKDDKGNEIEPFNHLFSSCEIDEDVTLGDFFNIVEKIPLLCLFLKSYSWCHPIDEFHKAAKLPLLEKERDPCDDVYTEDLWHLRIYRWVEGYDGKSIDFFPSFDGVGEIQDKSVYTHENMPDYEKYGIELSPMNELVHFPLIADPEIKIRNNKYNMGYTLLDILDAVYWEISFFGGPQDASDMHSTIKEQISAIKSELENGSEENFTDF